MLLVTAVSEILKYVPRLARLGVFFSVPLFQSCHILFHDYYEPEVKSFRLLNIIRDEELK